MRHFRSDNERFMSLSGIIMDLNYSKTVVSPLVEDIKCEFFPENHHPDEPVILHRTDIRKRNGAFRKLNDSDFREQFDASIFELLSESQYSVISVGVDKFLHSQHYVSPAHPYHYLLEVLVERYVRQLQDCRARGDVLVESRNPNANNKLNVEYRLLYEAGNQNISSDEIQRRLTSHELKFRRKDHNVAGLQVADLLAHPSHRNILCEDRGVPMDNGFGGRIVDVLRKEKYRRSPNGRISGYGTKWLK